MRCGFFSFFFFFFLSFVVMGGWSSSRWLFGTQLGLVTQWGWRWRSLVVVGDASKASHDNQARRVVGAFEASTFSLHKKTGKNLDPNPKTD